MSSILDLVHELIAVIDVMKKEVQKPFKDELLSIIYQINPTPTEYDLDKLLKDYNAKDLLELINKIKRNMVKK
ncbi:hypothetical protein DFR86_03990 [Acidianus sulfidivorans JP7]|uniref:Uncharacterized protein n=1 Tax=Acidianus sulfidivorans JP7 TaxID=619593 RepID=A0A2U9IQC2_9CREN|nr:hypothetical protein [Acidianus sulfidivorans]AWR98225.1 hypothetical protein DFR86_03990 [Acidianus sulfidivorans JP7]